MAKKWDPAAADRRDKPVCKPISKYAVVIATATCNHVSNSLRAVPLYQVNDGMCPSLRLRQKKAREQQVEPSRTNDLGVAFCCMPDSASARTNQAPAYMHDQVQLLR